MEKDEYQKRLERLGESIQSLLKKNHEAFEAIENEFAILAEQATSLREQISLFKYAIHYCSFKKSYALEIYFSVFLETLLSSQDYFPIQPHQLNYWSDLLAMYCVNIPGGYSNLIHLYRKKYSQHIQENDVLGRQGQKKHLMLLQLVSQKILIDYLLNSAKESKKKEVHPRVWTYLQNEIATMHPAELKFMLSSWHQIFEPYSFCKFCPSEKMNTMQTECVIEILNPQSPFMQELFERNPSAKSFYVQIKKITPFSDGLEDVTENSSSDPLDHIPDSIIDEIPLDWSDVECAQKKTGAEEWKQLYENTVENRKIPSKIQTRFSQSTGKNSSKVTYGQVDQIVFHDTDPTEFLHSKKSHEVSTWSQLFEYSEKVFFSIRRGLFSSKKISVSQEDIGTDEEAQKISESILNEKKKPGKH